jgi:acetate kinase
MGWSMRPERVLVVNAGSTSLKLHLVEGDESSAVKTFVECEAVGHRVVHGGTRFVEPVVIDEEVKAAIRELTPLAPLHNAPALAAIEDAQRTLPDVPHVAVFDTAFHRTMPEEATRYAVPEQWFDWGVRRYGFHGLSAEWAASQVQVPRLVVCHLGGGSSVTAVLAGRSVETTMGFSPLEGVPMTTRSGSIDPGALLYLLRERGLSTDQLDHALEYESGLAALSGTSGDVRELADDSLALAIFVRRVAAAVAASAAALGGVDAVAFTGGIGEHSALVRERVCERLRFLGPFAVHVVESREDLVIARAVRTAL